VEDINKHCLEEFRKHWQCLDNNNHQLWQCRPFEWKLNECVFEKLVRTYTDLDPTAAYDTDWQLLEIGKEGPGSAHHLDTCPPPPAPNLRTRPHLPRPEAIYPGEGSTSVVILRSSLLFYGVSRAASKRGRQYLKEACI
jgi:hypothetical protein